MKTSTILFSSICAITLGVQLLTNYGFKVAYQQEINKPQKSLLELPVGNIRVVVADSIDFEVHADSVKRGIYLTEYCDDLSKVVNFKMHGDTLWVKSKIGYIPSFIVYIPAVEVVMNRYENVLSYHSNHQQTLTTISQNRGQVAISGQYDELNVIASDQGNVYTRDYTRVKILNMKLTDEATFDSQAERSDSGVFESKIARLGKITASDKTIITLSLNGKMISDLTKK